MAILFIIRYEFLKLWIILFILQIQQTKTKKVEFGRKSSFFWEKRLSLGKNMPFFSFF